MQQVEHMLSVNCELGEGPIWHERDRNLRRLSLVMLIVGLLIGSAIASNAPLQEYTCHPRWRYFCLRPLQ